MNTCAPTVVLSLSLAWTAAAICPPEPPDLKPPLPPAGYSDTLHACTCDSVGQNCHWVWVGTNASAAQSPAVIPLDSAVLHDIATFNPNRTAAETREAEARAREADARAKLAERQAQVAASEDRDRIQRARADRDMQRFEDRIQTAKVRHADFSQAINQPEFQLTPAMQDAVFKSRVAGELAYWLATHLDESRRIANLSPSGTRREIHKIEATLPK